MLRIKRCNVRHANKRLSKAQVSVEYLIIIGVSFAILLPAAYFFYNYSKSSNDASIRSQINQIGNAMLTDAASVYGLSDGSLVTINVRYPKNIRDIYIQSKRELVIKYDLSSGSNEAVFFSNIDLTGNYNYTSSAPRPPCTTLPCADSAITTLLPQQGNHELTFQSETSYVLITQVQ